MEEEEEIERRSNSKFLFGGVSACSFIIWYIPNNTKNIKNFPWLQLLLYHRPVQ